MWLLVVIMFAGTGDYETTEWDIFNDRETCEKTAEVMLESKNIVDAYCDYFDHRNPGDEWMRSEMPEI